MPDAISVPVATERGNITTESNATKTPRCVCVYVHVDSKYKLRTPSGHSTLESSRESALPLSLLPRELVESRLVEESGGSPIPTLFNRHSRTNMANG